MNVLTALILRELLIKILQLDYMHFNVRYLKDV